ncbi:unnamed protein product [Enterobius vermicularis]|uniref:5'-3' exoribonuclease 1 n=1 Tax=Enterobius vermicularis TaxID=51028 RepID=A0A0N4VBL5_ENTVE|nr:unnamed protein product [Enterobius vermicularis]
MVILRLQCGQLFHIAHNNREGPVEGRGGKKPKGLMHYFEQHIYCVSFPLRNLLNRSPVRSIMLEKYRISFFSWASSLNSSLVSKMGVPKFYRWLSERYPCLSEIVSAGQIPEFDNLYFDMNGIIHGCSHPNDEDVFFRISEEEIFRDIFHYIETLFGIICPKKVFFMAVDGVAPRAKMNQQRARRFMSAKNAEMTYKLAASRGKEVSQEGRFDSNCITPGTQFMARLHTHLQYFIQYKITTDPLWQGIRIYLSGHDCPGEGEHKIMDFIRTERSKPDYDPDTRHCLYGLDADLIMLGACSHEPHFSLLREEVQFGRPRNNSKSQRTSVEKTTFHLLHISLLREYLGMEFKTLEDKISFKYDLESIIDDWVMLGFLVGNDFIPHLPYVHIHQDGLDALYNTYLEVLPRLDGYINENGILNLKRFEIFLKSFSKNDRRCFVVEMDDLTYLKSKQAGDAAAFRSKRVEEKREEEMVAYELSDGGSVSELASSEPETKGAVWTPSVNRAFKHHKRAYYTEKMKYKNISKEQLQEQAEGYVRAIQWNLHYYYHGCCSWNWFYPHHYAPYISDVFNFSDMKLDFELSEPFHPFEQLLAVLPAASASCLPVPFQELMLDESSPIYDFYPREFLTDLNGKKNDWEAVVLIPFIEEKRLLEAVATKTARLTEEERLRNSHGPHLLFTTDFENPARLDSSIPEVLESMENCVAKSQIVYGLLPGVHLDVYFPGFPTTKHIPYTSELRHANCCIFQQPTLKKSMIMSIIERPELQKDFSSIASDLLGKEVYVEWPILKKGLVHQLWTSDSKWLLGDDGTVACEELDPLESGAYQNHCNDLVKRGIQRTCSSEYKRFGIEVGERKAIVFAKSLVGISTLVEQEKVVVQKTWTSDLDLKNVLEDRRMYPNMTSITEAFPVGCSAFFSNTKTKFYGYRVVVESSGFLKKQSTAIWLNRFKSVLKVRCTLPINDLELTHLAFNIKRYSVQWFHINLVARPGTLLVTRNIVSRITGHVPLIMTTAAQYGSKQDRAERMNIGLCLKNPKKNLAIPGFAKRINDTWDYSFKTVRVLLEYRRRFPEVFNHLQHPTRVTEAYFAEEIWNDPVEREARTRELSEFLKSLPSASMSMEPADGNFLDDSAIKEVERIVSSTPKQFKTKHFAVKPSMLFRHELHTGRTLPDPDTKFELLDRVVCVRPLRGAPFSGLGTIIGITVVNDTPEVDVLFDECYFGGKSIREFQGVGVISLHWSKNLQEWANVVKC